MKRFEDPVTPGNPDYIPPGEWEDCPAASPDGFGYVCTRDDGHEPPHAAHLSDGSMAASWED